MLNWHADPVMNDLFREEAEMCIGIPMQILQVDPGHAVVEGFGEVRRVGTSLIEACAPGQWVIVFLNDAREIISPERAAEVTATLNLVASALGPDGQFSATGDPGFSLPSEMDATALNTFIQG